MNRARTALFLVFTLALLLAAPLRAAEPPLLLLAPPVGKTELPAYLLYSCPDRALTLAEATALDYKPLPSARVAFGYRHRECWFRFRLANPAARPRS